jgi:hypothetical protein
MKVYAEPGGELFLKMELDLGSSEFVVDWYYSTISVRALPKTRH